jgi:drug/metabolite transporter (DMT)-like permease
VSLLGRLAEVDLPVWSMMIWVIVLGTIAPFALIVGALRHLPATRVAIVAMLEPVLGSIVAFAWLEEALTPGQIAGGVLVLSGVAIAQASRG